MKPTKILIDALYSAANRIEAKNDDYNWCNFCSCNCGILAQEILKVDKQTLRQYIKDLNSWSQDRSLLIVKPSHFCPITGRPILEIHKLLYKYGLEKDDYHKIEFIGWTKDNSSWRGYKDKIVVAKYFRDLAKQLELERKQIEQNQKAKKPLLSDGTEVAAKSQVPAAVAT